jgi:hypothetical protein
LSGLTLVLIGALCLVLASAAGVVAWRYLDGGVGRVDGEVLFQDDFADPVSGWEVGTYGQGSVGYQDGAYSVVSNGDVGTMWGMSNRWFDDVAIDVDATQASGPSNNNNGYGIICRDQGDGDGYHLLISGDGLYSIYRAAGDDTMPLVAWTEAPEIRQGNATNHLRAVCDGSTLSLYVNDTLLATAEDDVYLEGDISLVMTSFEAEPSEALFDNLVVSKP